MIHKNFTLGIVGGGQLALFLLEAARRLGIDTAVFCEQPDSPALAIATHRFVGDLRDVTHIDAFSRLCDVVTIESENIHFSVLNYLETRTVLRPSLNAIGIFQDRLSERTFLEALEVPSVPFVAVAYEGDIRDAMTAFNSAVIVKTRTGGYDGKGQVRIDDKSHIYDAYMTLGERPAVCEKVIQFRKELSCVAARNAQGQFVCYDVVENQNEHHMLRTSVVPAAVDEAVCAQVIDITRTIANALGYVGVLAVEFFLCDNNQLLVNEVAPRVHNTGHWTLDACQHNQFELHVRAVCGLPLPPHAQRYANARMTNILGSEIENLAPHIANPQASVYVYGKKEVRAYRKMGHVTTLSSMS